MLSSASDIPVLVSLRNDPSYNTIRSAINAVRSRHSEDPETAANLASILAASGESIVSTGDLVDEAQICRILPRVRIRETKGGKDIGARNRR